MSRGFLLDTHTLLWWLFEAERMSMSSFDVVADKAIDVHVSAISAYEIATKFKKGQLPGAKPIIGRFPEMAEEEGFIELPITSAHGETAGAFKAAHRDPWDRLLAAQAKVEQLTLLTNDREMVQFGIRTYW